MPGKRKATNKSVDKKDEKETKEVAHKTKATKKTKSDEEEEMEEEVPKRSSRSKSKDVLAASSKDKKSKSPSKSPSKSKGKGKGKKDEDEEDEEKEKKTESPTKGAKGKGKGKDKKEDKEEKKNEKEEKEEEKGKGKGKKGTATKKDEGNGNSRKLNRNRDDDDLEDTVADEIEDPKFDLGDGKIPENEIIISSWNVAGLTGMLKKTHLQDYLKDRKPHIMALNETKFTPDTLKAAGTAWIPEGYTSYFNNCKTKKGYSGTAILTKYKPLNVHFGIGVKKHDKEGRTITLEFEHFYLISCYVPNAGEKLVGLDYRTKDWDNDFSKYLNNLKTKKHVILCGDLNVAYEDIDIYETKGKHKFAGFTPEERKGFGNLLGTGFIDTFRHLHPKEQKFSYFSARFPKLKAENRGWRLDYFVIDKEGLKGVKDSLINEKINGSDHLPIELVLNPHFK